MTRKITLRLTVKLEEILNSHAVLWVICYFCILLNGLDVIQIDKTNEKYRVLYDVKGRFILRSIKKEEANVKL